MSTRYVWDVYDTKQKPELDYDTTKTTEINTIDSSYTYFGVAAQFGEYNEETGAFTLTGLLPVTTSTIGSDFLSAADYPYFCLRRCNSVGDQIASVPSRVFHYPYDLALGAYYWSMFRDTADNVRYLCLADAPQPGGTSGYNINTSTYPKGSFRAYKTKNALVKGDVKTGVASSANRNRYPDDGASNGSWYVYRGSDSIDPLSVTYSTNSPERGEAVTVVVKPRQIEENVPQWTASSLPQENGWSGIAFGAGWFVAVGGNAGGAARSSDGGKTWVLASQQELDGVGAVTYGNGKFVAVGLNCAWYSTDNGAAWTAAASLPDGQWHAVCYGGGKFVAVSSSAPKAMYSSDGNVWMESAIPSSREWFDVAYGNGRFVAIGYGEAAYSSDGGSWTVVRVSTDAAIYLWRNITFGGGKFVAVGAHDVSAYSTDGQNWTEAAMPGNFSWNGISRGNGRFIAVGSAREGGGSNVSAFSIDGESWETMSMPTTAYWYRVAYGNDGFVAVSLTSSNAAYLPNEIDPEYTVSYLYQYSTNGGASWVNAGGITTDTQKEITIPNDAEQFMVRVRAQDDIGFTSNDYVSGANLTVQTIRLWIGVANTAKQGRKLWIGVDGKARRAVRAWVGDETGKARRWF